MMHNYSKLEDVAEVIDSLHKTPSYSLEGYAMVRCTDVKYGRLNLQDTFKVDKDVFKEFSRRYTPQQGDIIITRVGSYGNTAFVEDTNFCLGQNTAAIVPKINPRFLYYALNSVHTKNQIEFSVVGSTQKTLSLKAINNLEIPRFESFIEDKIAEIIGSLDDKIDLNRQINQTLEAMAQAIFKSWFVDFDPVKAKIAAIEAGQDPLRAAMSAISGKNDAELDAMSRPQYDELAATAALFPEELVESELGDVPKGWMISDLRSLAEVISKGTTPNKADLARAEDEPVVPFIKVKDLLVSGEVARGNLELVAKSIHETSLKRSILKTDDLLFSIAGTIGRTAFVDDDLNGSNLNQAIAFIRLKEKNNHFSLCWLSLRSLETQEFIASKVVQAVQANTSLANIGDIPITLPNDSVLSKWNSLVTPLINKYRVYQRETRYLTELRDTLLPKLLSGELSVAEIEEVV